MASENETFDEVLRCIQNDIVHFVGKPVKHSRDLLQEYHDRFKAAHRREMEVLHRRLEAVVKHLEKYKGTKEPDYCCADCIEDIAKEVGFSFASGDGGAE